MTSPGYREFEFDLPGALLVRLVSVLDEMQAAPLTTPGLAGVPEAQGVYQLFLDGQLVYIGKTDAEAGLLRRLSRHSSKILHRRGLAPERVSFKAVRIFVFTAIDLETQLIKHYAGEGGTAWNGSGFGSNDPGRNRDRSVIRGKNFDALFPIDIDLPVDIDLAGEQPAAQLLGRLKSHLPYTLRFQTRPNSRSAHPDLAATIVHLPVGASSTREILAQVTRQLPLGWQATAFRSHVILYNETVDDYPAAEVLARS